MEADISIWRKPGHFYFALTGISPGISPGRVVAEWNGCRVQTLWRNRVLSGFVRSQGKIPLPHHA